MYSVPIVFHILKLIVPDSNASVVRYFDAYGSGLGPSEDSNADPLGI